MNYNELVRLALQPGPMQDMAIQALTEEYEADDRVDKVRGRGQNFDFERFGREYLDEYVNAPHVPAGDEDDSELRAEWAMGDLEDMYENLYPESLPEKVGGVLSGIGGYLGSQEGVNATSELLRDSFAPVYSQMDSYDWGRENLDKYLDLRERDPLTATGYLPLAALGAIGSIPGLSSLVSGGRKLGLAGKAAFEGLY